MNVISVDVDHDEHQERLDLQKVQALRALHARLTRELNLWDQLEQGLAVLRSNEILGQLGVISEQGKDMPESTPEGRAMGAKQRQTLVQSKGRLIEGMRHACYECTNKLKQYSSESKTARRAVEDNGAVEDAVDEVLEAVGEE